MISWSVLRRYSLQDLRASLRKGNVFLLEIRMLILGIAMPSGHIPKGVVSSDILS
jgi:hypothetical protein